MKRESISILNPVVSVTIRGESVEVRELLWKDFMKAVKDLGASLIGLGGLGKNLDLDRSAIVDALTGQEKLVEFVICKSTGRDSAFVNALTAKEAIDLIQAVVDLNLSEEVIASGKKLAGQMSAVLGLKKQSPAPLITSSAPAIPSPTQTNLPPAS